MSVAKLVVRLDPAGAAAVRALAADEAERGGMPVAAIISFADAAQETSLALGSRRTDPTTVRAWVEEFSVALEWRGADPPPSSPLIELVNAVFDDVASESEDGQWSLIVRSARASS